MTIPLVDPIFSAAEHHACLEAVARVARSRQMVGGPEVEWFEDAWGRAVGARAVAVSSGTAALTLILRALSARHPDRDTVVVPAFSFVATAEAVRLAGLRPAYARVDACGLMTPQTASRAIWNASPARVLAVVPVHLYGQVADAAGIESAARFSGVPNVVEDACQAHGARYGPGRGPPVGGLRNPAAWSFMPAKILGAWGDAGAVTVPADDPELEARVRALANHGRTSHNVHAFPGDNARMDALQAAVLNAKLPYLAAYLNLRRRLARRYQQLLGSDSPLAVQLDAPGRVWSYFACRAVDRTSRDRLLERLRAAGISAGVHYPYALPTVYGPGPSAEHAEAERIADTTITLPLWPGMSPEQQDRVVAAVRNPQMKEPVDGPVDEGPDPLV